MSDVILLTGASGFVGQQILAALRQAGKRMRLIALRGEGHMFAGVNEIESVVETDDLFAEPCEWWLHAGRDIDTVIHAAWYVEPGKYLQSPLNLNCLQGTITMAQGLAKAGIRRFVGIGTCFEYDVSRCVLDVDTPLKPLTIYAGAKASVFITLSQWLPSQNIEFAWCRLFYLYGLGEDTRRLAPYVRAQLAADKPAELTGGNQIRDYLDVREAGALIVKAALGKFQGPLNICSGVPVTVRQFVEKIADEYGRRDLLHFGARPDNLMDPPCVLGVKTGGL